MPAIRVLLIEDDFGAGDLFQAAITPDYEVLRASNGLEGMRLALNGQPDVIVTDIMMPVMDGHEFVRRLRRFEGYENLPVIFISSLSSAQDVKKGYDLGAALYLNKPLEPKRFRRNLDLFVDDRQITPSAKRLSVPEAMAALTGAIPGGQGSGEETWTRRPGDTSVNRRAPSGPSDSQVRRPGAAPSPSDTQSRRPGAQSPAPAPSDTQARRAAAAKAANPDSQARARVPMNPLAIMQAQQSKEASQPARLRILIIEHEAEALKGMSQGLEGEFEIVPAHDGMEAIERMIRYHPEIFIIDAQVPKMTANHLITMIRKDPNFQRSPVIYLSSKLDAHTTYQLERMGIKDLLPKPVTLAMLKTVVHKAITDRATQINQGRLPWEQVRMELGIAEGFRTAVYNPFIKGNSALIKDSNEDTSKSSKVHVHKVEAPEESWRD